MLIPIVAVVIGLSYFLYPPRFAWVRTGIKYLVAIFCFWTALVFARFENHEMIYRPAGFFLLLLAGLLLLIDFLLGAFHKAFGKTASLFRRTPKLAPYLHEIWSTFEKLAASKTGALIVLEQKESLHAHIQGGMSFDAEIRSETLAPLFFETSSVHDGAFVVRKGRLQSVKGILPLATFSDTSSTHLGTRHRAAVGITEKTDAIALTVSEEHAFISAASRGSLVKINSRDEFVRVMDWILKQKSIRKLKDAEFIANAKVLEDFA